MKDVQITFRQLFQSEQKPVTFSYLNMIWDVKIFLAKIKERKGKEI